MKVYELTHEYELTEDGDIYDIVSHIAIYSSEEKAKLALKKFRDYPKFAKHPDGFEITAWELDKSDWSEGFTPLEDDHS